MRSNRAEQSDASTWVELNGVLHRYLRYGEETIDGQATFTQPCHVCSCLPGQVHAAGCPLGAGGLHQRPATCRDCGTAVGSWHVGGCCVEQCPSCGGQFHTCDCDVTIDGVIVEDDEID